MKETDNGIARLDDIVKEISRQVSLLKRQASRAQNRETLKAELSTSEKALYGDRFVDLTQRQNVLRKDLASTEDSEATAQTALQRIQAEEQEARNNLMTIDVQTDEVRAQIDDIREELSRRQQQRSERRARMSELKAIEAAKETEIKRHEERVGTFAAAHRSLPGELGRIRDTAS